MADENIFVRLRLLGQRAYSHDMREAARDTDRLGASAGHAGASARGASRDYDAFGRVLRLVRPAAMITALGLLAQGTSAAAAGGVALGSALAPVSGALVAYPALAAAGAQGLGVFKLATSGVADVVGGLGDRIDRTSHSFKVLGPDARRLAVHLGRLKNPLIALQRIAQHRLLPGLDEGIARGRSVIPTLRPIAGRTSSALGGLASRAGGMLASRGLRADIATQGERNVVWISRGGRAGLRLASSLRHVTVAAGPLVNWMTKGALQFARFADHEGRAGRESGRLAKFFQHTRFVMSSLVSTALSLGRALFNIGKAGTPLGNSLLSSVSKNAAMFARWTDSARGHNAIANFFRRARAPIYALAHLLRDVVVAFARLGAHTGLAPMIDQIRTRLLPILVRVANSTTQAFGPHLIELLVAMATAFEPLAGSSGPLVVFVDIMTGLARASTWIAQTVPGGSAAITTLFGALALWKGLQLASLVTGLGGFVGFVRTMTPASRAAAAAEGTLTAAQWLLNAAIAANPIVLAVAALAALGVAFVVAYKKVGWFHDGVNALWGAIKSLASGIGTVFKKGLELFVNSFVWRINRVIDVMNLAIEAYNKIPFSPDIGKIGHVGNVDFTKPGATRNKVKDYGGLLKVPSGIVPQGAHGLRAHGASAGSRTLNLNVGVNVDRREVGRASARGIDDDDRWGRD